MNASELVAVKRRLSRAEAERLVSEFEQVVFGAKSSARHMG